jgi:hypothetical protein
MKTRVWLTNMTKKLFGIPLGIKNHPNQSDCINQWHTLMITLDNDDMK